MFTLPELIEYFEQYTEVQVIEVLEKIGARPDQNGQIGRAHV